MLAMHAKDSPAIQIKPHAISDAYGNNCLEKLASFSRCAISQSDCVPKAFLNRFGNRKRRESLYFSGNLRYRSEANPLGTPILR